MKRCKLHSVYEIIFRRQCTHRFTVPQPLPFIEQVTVTKLLGIYISATFSTVTLVEHILKAHSHQARLRPSTSVDGRLRPTTPC